MAKNTDFRVVGALTGSRMESAKRRNKSTEYYRKKQAYDVYCILNGYGYALSDKQGVYLPLAKAAMLRRYGFLGLPLYANDYEILVGILYEQALRRSKNCSHWYVTRTDVCVVVEEYFAELEQATMTGRYCIASYKV